ncbi:unnamed protein product, partial [Vitis vinifera]|uniref:Uncharacterized protein n=1 Tax=Vitis vinifera TaxID=29760 RepID=D7UE35_VITVI
MTLHLVDNMRNTGNLRQVPQFLCREIAYANDSSLAKIISASIAFHVLGISDWVRFSDLKPTEPFFIQTDQWIRYKSTQHIVWCTPLRTSKSWLQSFRHHNCCMLLLSVVHFKHSVSCVVA